MITPPLVCRDHLKKVPRQFGDPSSAERRQQVLMKHVRVRFAAIQHMGLLHVSGHLKLSSSCHWHGLHRLIKPLEGPYLQLSASTQLVSKALSESM